MATTKADKRNVPFGVHFNKAKAEGDGGRDDKHIKEKCSKQDKEPVLLVSAPTGI